MQDRDRARIVAPAFLAAVAGSAAVGIATLAREGVCLHRVTGLHAGLMPGMAMGDAAAPAMSGPCPILVGAAVVAAVLYVFALGALVVARPALADVAVASARLVLGVRFAPLAALLAVAGAVPLGSAIAMDGGVTGATTVLAAVFLIASAVLCASALSGAARVVVAFARRLAVSLVTAFRLLSAAGALTPWLAARQPLLISAGVRLARRRPSRAPPVLH